MSATVDPLAPRILRGVTPAVDEGLIALMARSCRASHMSSVTTLLAAGTPVGHAFINLAVRDELNPARLAWAARLPTCEIDARRYAPVKISSNLHGVTFHGATIARYDLELKARRIAPHWLRAGGHESAIAHHGLLTHCPDSGDLLIDRCPRCAKCFSWTISDLRKCPACRLDLRTIDEGRLPAATIRATSLMMNLIHPDPKRHVAASQRLPAAIAHLHRGDAFELGWRVGAIVTGYGTRARDEAKTMDVQTRIRILEAGSSMLGGWPESLRQHCNKTAAESGAAGVHLLRQLRSALKVRGAWPSHRQLLVEALPALGISDKAALKSVVQHAGNAADTQRVLGVGQKAFERLRKSGALKPIADGGSVKLHQIFGTATLTGTAAMLADRIDFGAVSQRLGISHHGVAQLCGLDHLQALNDEVSRTAFVRQHVRRSAFDDLLSRLNDCAKGNAEEGEVPLRRLMFAIGGREKPWGAVVSAMLDGRLPFRIEKGAKPFTHRVHISLELLSAIIKMAEACAPYNDATLRLINGRDAEEMLNVNPRIFQQAIAAGDVMRDQRDDFVRLHVTALARRHISGGEILMRWGIGRKMPPPLKARAERQKLGHLGWDRTMVEAVMENWRAQQTDAVEERKSS